MSRQTITLSPAQRDNPACDHTRQTQTVTPASSGCQACLEMGDTWVHLRVCLTCGHVGCCDSSKNKHATKHARTADHPVVRSFEPGETWAYCYPDNILL